jgi:hypothetical protein
MIFISYRGKEKEKQASKKQQAIPGFLRFVEQTVSWLYEGAHAILEMLFSKRFLAAGGKIYN